MIIHKPSADAVRAYRDEHECGIHEAKAAVMKEWRKRELEQIRLRAGELYTVEACGDVIRDLIELLQESDQ